MPVDPEFLRKHYASLSEDAFDAIDPDDLVDEARRVYDEEAKQRKRPSPQAKASGAEPRGVESEDVNGEPDWLEDAAVATTIYAYPGDDSASEADDVRATLEEAGIPCRISTQKPQAERRQPDLEYRVLVPSRFNLEAGGILDQRVYSEDYTNAWIAHFHELGDDELRELNLDLIFGALRENIERITQAYEEELDAREKGAKRRR